MLAGAKWRRAFSTNNMRQKATGRMNMNRNSSGNNNRSYIPEIKMQNFKKILVEKPKTWESYNRAF
jgi:hypothetical protein